MPSISFAICCKDELTEIQTLIPFIDERMNSEDEVVVLWDDSGDPKVWDYLIYEFKSKFQNDFTFKKHIFLNNFADWKNYLNSLCTKGDFIFNLDCDEVPHEFLLNNIKNIIINNPEIELFWVPRINIVDNIGLSHVEKWNWGISKMENLIKEKEFDLDNPQDKDEYELLKKYGLIIEEK